MKTALLAGIAFLGLAALYLLFAGEVSVTELLAGLPAAALAAVLIAASHAGQDRKLRLQAPWPHILRQLAGALLTETWHVGAALSRAILHGPRSVSGITTTQDFRIGGPHAADAGRRAIVTLAVSLTPNGYAVDGNDSGLIVHRLVPAPPTTDREWPL